MTYCKLHSFIGSEQDSKDCSECHIEREKEVPFLANLDTRTRAEAEFDEGIGGKHNYETNE